MARNHFFIHGDLTVEFMGEMLANFYDFRQMKIEGS